MIFPDHNLNFMSDTRPRWRGRLCLLSSLV
jgi:hypothetical protein